MGLWDNIMAVTNAVQECLDIFSDGLLSDLSDEELWSILKNKDQYKADKINVVKSALRHRGYNIK